MDAVTDPTDWNSSNLPNLADLDSLLRCFICKDFLKGPMLTSCNHIFCSHCIREYLLNDNTCPLCKTEQYESNLRRVGLLEDIALSFNRSRPALLDLLKKGHSRVSETTTPSKSASTTPITTSKRSSPEIIEIVSDSESDPSTISHPAKKLRPNTRSSSRQSIMESFIKSKSKSKSTAVPLRTEMVECPICSSIMSAEELQANHIDTCLNGGVSAAPRNASTISSFFRKSSTLSEQTEKKAVLPPAQKLPKLDFDSLSTSKLREKLSSLSLPTSGTRHQLKSRYNEYYILFNSNLDSNHPVDEKVLRRKLSQWEMNHEAFNGGVLVTGKSITDKTFSAKLWSQKYNQEFVELTKSAKRALRIRKVKELDEKTNVEVKADTKSEEEILLPEIDDFQNINQVQTSQIDIAPSSSKSPSPIDTEVLKDSLKESLMNNPLFMG